MKRKLTIGLFILEALLCAGLCLMKANLTDAFTAAVAFPFEQIGLGLRALSLSGLWGNTAALVLYLALCLLPAVLLIPISQKRRLHAEDGFLVLLSALLFVTLYEMTNPGRLGALFSASGDSGLAVGKAVLGGTIYSALVGYVVLRLLRLSFESGAEKLRKYLGALLLLLNVLFVWAIFYSGLSGLLASFASLREGNTDPAVHLGMSYAFLVLRFLTNALPYALDFVTVFIVLRLIREMAAGRYSQQAVDAANRLSKWCAGALAAVVLTSVACNVLQLFFAGTLYTLDGTLNLPLTSLLFVLAALLFARIAAENQAFKEDSDLII